MGNYHFDSLRLFVQQSAVMSKTHPTQAEADQREAEEFADLTKKFGVNIVMESPRLVYGTFGPQSGPSKQIWKLTGDKCSPSQYQLEFSDPWAARRKAIEIMRNIAASAPE